MTKQDWDLAVWPDGTYHWHDDGPLPDYKSDDYRLYILPEGQDPDEFLAALFYKGDY